jgi:integrase
MQKKTFNFTQSRVRAINPPEPKPNGGEVRESHYDETQPKLKLISSSTGAKTYYVSKKDSTGKLKNVRIGKASEWTVEDARDQATEILAQINKGTDPNKEKRKQKLRSIMLEQLLNDYIENHDLKPRTIRDYQDKVRWGFADWMNRPASDITDEMVLARHKKLSQKGKTATNDAFVRLRAILNYGHVISAIGNHNPVTILSNARLWHKRNHRKEIIQSHQLAEWVNAVEQITPRTHQTAFLMMLYMGFRIMETYELQWKNVDLTNNLITQRDTKNGTDHELPIPSLLIPIIKELHTTTGESYFLFPSVARGLQTADAEKHLTYPKKPIKQINDRIGFHFNPHMTRHTFTTIAEAVGTPKTMIDRLTNHTTTNDVTGGYIHTETETLREAINKIAAYIQVRLGESEKVVQLYG